MSILTKLASALGRGDEVPNQVLAKEIATAEDHQDIDDGHQQDFFLNGANSGQPGDKRLDRWVNKEKDSCNDSEDVDRLIEQKNQCIVWE